MNLSWAWLEKAIWSWCFYTPIASFFYCLACACGAKRLTNPMPLLHMLRRISWTVWLVGIIFNCHAQFSEHLS